MKRLSTVDEVVAGIRRSEKRAIARAITWLENGSSRGWSVMEGLAGTQGRARRIGVTGPPGAGKSTLVDGLVRLLRQREEQVGVLAVDPSSPFSGGSLLGDRIRMTRALEDREIFVRSMASRGSLGGIARTAQEALDILDSAGYTQLILETVGVGQSELAVASACDITLVVLVPEAGGVVQAMKAGVMEIADIFVVNKAERPGGEEMELQLKDAAKFLKADGWTPPVIPTTALKDEGVPALLEAIDRRWAWMQEGERLTQKRRAQARSRIRDVVRSGLEEQLWSQEAIVDYLNQDAERLMKGELSLSQAALDSWDRIRQVLAETSLLVKEDNQHEA